jgi:hypothetical protein
MLAYGVKVTVIIVAEKSRGVGKQGQGKFALWT